MGQDVRIALIADSRGRIVSYLYEAHNRLTHVNRRRNEVFRIKKRITPGFVPTPSRRIVTFMPRVTYRFLYPCLTATLLLVGCGTVKGDTRALEQSLTTEVPLHSTQAHVIELLNSRKIAHSTYQHTEDSGNSIEAEIAVPAPHNFVQPTYDVLFRFDDNGLLKSYDIQYLGYVGR